MFMSMFFFCIIVVGSFIVKKKEKEVAECYTRGTAKNLRDTICTRDTSVPSDVGYQSHAHVEALSQQAPPCKKKKEKKNPCLSKWKGSLLVSLLFPGNFQNGHLFIPS